MSRPTWDTSRSAVASLKGVSPAMPVLSRTLRLTTADPFEVPQPRMVNHPVWAVPCSLATTDGISVDFFSCGY